MLQNMKVAGKLGLGFGLILLFIVGLGIMSLQRMSVVNEQSA